MAVHAKQDNVVGTHHSNAFLLSLRDPNELNIVHSYGVHCVPHIGKWFYPNFYYRQQQYTCTPAHYPPILFIPQPPVDTVCAGCRGGYPKKPDGSLPDPPYDICISHEETITLTDPLSKKPFNKQSKTHYPHATMACRYIDEASIISYNQQS